jgi:hypothetical protein
LTKILLVDDLRGDITIEIYFACLFFIASVYVDEPLKLVQEEYHCACSSKAHGKAAKSIFQFEIFK